MTSLFTIRLSEEKDRNFILATFLRGLYYGDSWFSLIPKHVFMDNYKKVGEALTDGSTTIKIACLNEDPNVIIGYVILNKSEDTVVWVYVKSAFRRRGVAKALLPKQVTTITHLTKLGKSLLYKINNPIFNPFKVG